MRIALVHNLLRGGAHRRIAEQLPWIEACAAVDEYTLEGSNPVTSSPRVTPLRQLADHRSSLQKPIERYLDLARVEHAWRSLDQVVSDGRYDAVWLNPCRFLQAPPLREQLLERTVYYCDEPNRQFYDPSARGSTRRLTRPLYYGLNRRKQIKEVAVSQHVAVILTNSSYTASMIGRAFGRPAHVCHLGVSPRFELREEGAPRTGVLSVGTLIPSKGHDLAIAALAAASDTRSLTIVAPRREIEEQARLQRLSDELGVPVSFRFGVSDDELIDLYRSTELTLYLAKAEPFGLVSLEAQASGSPVIVADEGGLPETVEGSPLGVAVARDRESVASALQTQGLGLSADERIRLAQAVSDRWSWERSSGILAKEFVRVADR